MRQSSCIVGRYSETGRAREGGTGAACRLIAGLMLASGLGACSITMPVGSLAEDQMTTGSISGQRQATSLSPALNDEDWRRAQSALGLAVDPQGNGAPVSWDNPESGRKGSFAAAGPLYVLDNRVCRSFIARLNAPEPDTQLQGSSCRLGPNDWVVKDVKPWKPLG